MRHTLLTELVQSNVSLEKVRQIAGNSKLKTTEQYLHIKLDDTRSVLELSEERRKILRLDFLRKTK
jgi:site-specific recombinase XerD